ncbi:MAG: FAD-dependent oxidoreductase [Leptospiraceae bacterium]|nr:FAD-dependent oxidoreductase [Leptospiraceae bacterium]
MMEKKGKHKNSFKKIILVVLIIAFIITGKYFEVEKFLSFEYLKTQKDQIQSLYSENQLTFIVSYFLIYVISTAFSIPGAAILTIAAGALFGVLLGTVIVSFASTIGATLSFILSRYILRESIQERFKDTMDTINKGIEKDGVFYLLTLRLIPAFPFFLINLVMGITKISLLNFFWASQLGMLAGTIVFVNAGTQLANINSTKDILSIPIILSFVALGIVPIIIKFSIQTVQNYKLYSKFKKPKNFEYNMVVLGAGAAGLVSSLISATVKAKVALIERHKMGGDCLNTGCVPSKALIASAKKVHLAKKAVNFGLSDVKIKFDFKKIMNRVEGVVKKIEPNDSIERYTGLGVECITGDAKIISPFEVQVGDKILTTKNIIIATGAEPLVPNIPGLQDVNYLSSENLWQLNKLPSKLLVLGAGPIGCELSQAFSRLGSNVTLVEMADRIMPREEKEVSEYITKIFEKEEINILSAHKLTSIKTVKSKNVAVLEKNGKNFEVEFDEILLSLGRKARVTGFGLEELGIEISPKGTIEVNEFLQTKYPNIYACGDVAGPYQFTHTASHQAWYASVNALFGKFKKFKADYRVIPWTTYTDPEVAHVGLTESDAGTKGIEFEVSKFDISELDRAITDGEENGFIKVITELGSDKILGVTIVSQNAGELLAEYVLAMKYNLGLNKILGTIHSYPTMSEANKFVAGTWKKAHKPEKLLEYVEKYHKWMRG